MGWCIIEFGTWCNLMKYKQLLKVGFFKLFLFLLYLLSTAIFAYSTPSIINLELTLSTNRQGFLEGSKRVRVDIITKAIDSTDPQGDVTHASMDLSHILFTNGFTSFTIDLAFDFNGIINNFSLISNPYFKLYITEVGTDFDEDLYVYIPVPATPYAVQARSAETVLSIDPNAIQGVFNQQFIQVSGNFLVTSNGQAAFVVSNNKVGVGKLPDVDTNFLMDVEGNFNAESIFIGGEPITSVVSPWQKEGDLVYLLDSHVGVNIDQIDNNYALNVSGSINADQYFIAGQDLFTYLSSEGFLSWVPVSQSLDFNGIYIQDIEGTDFRVGINIGSEHLNEITEALTVSGAIKIGSTIQVTPEPGTISYQDGRFYGWTHQLGQVDLVGIQLYDEQVSINHLLYWHNQNYVANSSLTISPNVGWLGINAEIPSAQLHIVSDDQSDILRIDNAQGDTFFQMNAAGNIGISADIVDDYKMNINGILNATDIYLDGQPILEALQNTSLMVSELSENWVFSDYHQTGGDAAISMYQLYYDWGFVGIGTSSPNVMLELKGNDNVAVVFNQVDGGSYIMGVSDDDPEKFMLGTFNTISSGFETPLMTFDISNDTKLGIGTSDPRASLHVVAETGFLVEGKDDQEASPINIENLEGSLMLFDVARNGAFAASNRSSWDQNNLGDGAVLLGFNGIAAGNFSTVLGGESNIARGSYSLALGGQSNTARGVNSVAMGTYAQANHNYSFVWSDNAFAGQAQNTSEDNQFIIRARGGVGINTNITNGTVLSLQADNETQSLIKTYNSSNDVVFNLTEQGQLSIGKDNPRAGLDVSGNIVIGSTTPEVLNNDSLAALSIFHKNANNNIIDIRNSDNEPVFVITSEGKIGIGIAEPRYPLQVSGSIYADSYLQDIDGSVEDLMSLLVWQYDSESDDNSIYFDKGFVGIGTQVPSAQLHLVMTSNMLDLSNRVDPLLSFSSHQSDSSFSMGLILDDRDADTDLTNDPSVFVMIASSNASMNVSDFDDSSSFLLAVSGNSVGMGTIDPEGALTVSGSTYLTGPVYVGGFTDVSDDQLSDMPAQAGALYAQQLFVQRLMLNDTEILEFKDDQSWKLDQQDNSPDVLYTTYNVFVGDESVPDLFQDSDVVLMVSGSLLAQHVSFNAISFLDSLTVNQVNFTETSYLKVENNNLIFNGTALNSTLETNDTEIQGSGPLAFWVDANSIYKLPVLWNGVNNELISTASISVQRDVVFELGDVISQNLSMGFTSPNNSVFKIDSVLNPSMPGEGFSHTAMDINIHLADAWNVQQTLTGMSLSVDTQNQDNSYLFTDVVGLSVSLNNFQGPRTYAAVFNGAPVLIGFSPDDDIFNNDTNSNTLLYVNGTVSMNTLLANNAAINLDQLQSNGLIVANNIVGVGFSEISELDPLYPFQVSGNTYITGNVYAEDLTIDKRLAIGNQFLIDDSGAFVIGSTNTPTFTESYPTATLLISKNVGSASSYVAQKMDLLFNFSLDSLGVADETDLQDSIALNVDVTGLDMVLNSDSSNRYNGHIRGIVISMNNLFLADGSQGNIVGLDIDVSKPSDDTVMGNRYAAVFNGGPVGIGVSDPQYDLHVSGNIFTNLLHTDDLVSEFLTVNSFLIADQITSNIVTVNQLFVNQFDVSRMFVENEGITINLLPGMVTANQLDVSTINILSAMTFSEPVTVNYLTVNRLALFENLDLNFTGQLATINALTVSSSFTLSSNAGFAVSSGNQDLLVLSANRLGIGTQYPSASLHIVSLNALAYDITNPDTWSVMKLQSFDSQATGIQFKAASQRAGLVFDSSDESPAFSFVLDIPKVSEEGNEFQQIMRINEHGVGIGVDNLQEGAMLQVSGSVRVSGSITADEFEANALTLNDYIRFQKNIAGSFQSYFHVTENGQMMSHVTLNNLESPYVMHDLFLNLDLASYTPFTESSELLPENHVIVDGQAMLRSAVDAQFDSIVGYQLSASNLTVGTGSLTGLEIDLSDISVNGDASVVGLSVNVSSDLLEAGKRYAALFQGKVGIGTFDPETDLHVVGDVSANRFIFNSAELLTINNLVVEHLSVNALSIYGTNNAEFHVNSLVADIVSVNSISVNSMTLVNELRVSSLNADIATFNYIGLGYEYDPEEDYVMKVSGSIFVEGKLFAKDLEVEGVVGTIHFPQIQSQTSLDNAQEWEYLTINHLISNTLHVQDYLTTNRLVFSPNSNQDELLSNYLNQNFLYFDNSSLRFHSSSDTTGFFNDISLLDPFILNANTQNPSIAQEGNLLFYDEEGSIYPLASLRYIDHQNTFQFGSSEFPSLNQVEIYASLSDENNTPTQGLLLNFELDTTSTSSEPVIYRGLDISFHDNSQEDILLASNETAIGLFVDMSSIQTAANVNRYAAVFNGGMVGINTETPDAVLHIAPSTVENDDTNLFRIESSSDTPILNITSSSVLINLDQAIDNQNAIVQIQGDSSKALFNIFDEADNVIFEVSANSVYISPNVIVDGTLVADVVSVNSEFQSSEFSTKYLFLDTQTTDVNKESMVSLNFSFAAPLDTNAAPKTFIGLDINLSSGKVDAENYESIIPATFAGVSELPDGTFYGMRVNLDGLDAIGKKHYSAGFFGAPMIISAIQGFDDVISSISGVLDRRSVLNIVAPNYLEDTSDGNLNQFTDNVARFMTLHNTSNDSLHLSGKLLNDIPYYSFSGYNSSGVPSEKEFLSFIPNNTGGFLFLGDLSNSDYFATNTLAVLNSIPVATLVSDNIGLVNGMLSFFNLDYTQKANIGITNNVLTLDLVDPTNKAFKISRGSGLDLMKIKSDSNANHKVFMNLGNAPGTIETNPFEGFTFNKIDPTEPAPSEVLLSNHIADSLLYVRGKHQSNSNRSYTAAFESLGSDKGVAIILREPTSSSIPEELNFLEFWVKSTNPNNKMSRVGRVRLDIDSNGDKSVAFETSGADYAEYLPKKDISEHIDAKQIVGVKDGLITKNTSGAQQILVMSSAPIIAANDPQKNYSHYGLVAFLGQVLTNVTGPVNKGDFIIASGKNDGKGFGVAPSNLQPEHYSRIVGRAWSSTSSQGDSVVNVAIGSTFSAVPIQQQVNTLSSYRQELNELNHQVSTLEQQIQDSLTHQQRLINRLKSQTP